MTKLESLKSSKFETFKENQIHNLIAIVGGVILTTNEPRNGSNIPQCDSYDTASDGPNGQLNNKDYGDCPPPAPPVGDSTIVAKKAF